MIKKINGNKIAVILLHEIYGINKFMKDLCEEYHVQGYDVFCPDMLQHKVFSYSHVSEAYHYFMKETGFEYDTEIRQLAVKLKMLYDKVFIIGFSVGATIAWRCCKEPLCDGIVCCYGSRIRDELLLQPCCPVLLLFAGQDSFDAGKVAEQLQGKYGVEVHIQNAAHGFFDPYSEHFNGEQMQISKEYISDFIIWHT